MGKKDPPVKSNQTENCLYSMTKKKKDNVKHWLSVTLILPPVKYDECFRGWEGMDFSFAFAQCLLKVMHHIDEKVW